MIPRFKLLSVVMRGLPIVMAQSREMLVAVVDDELESLP
jgi:hypothetical protein